ncbi:MAG: hypothetical protein ACTS73_08875 [Arsenophonus sp. NEOnobi-MAG3]
MNLFVMLPGADNPPTLMVSSKPCWNNMLKAALSTFGFLSSLSVVRNAYLPQRTIQTAIWGGMLRLKCLMSNGVSHRQRNMVQQLVTTALSEICKKRRRVATMTLLARHIHL